MGDLLTDGAHECTVLLTDIEESTRLWERFPDRMETVVRDHNQLIAGAVEEAHGAVVRSTGDGILALFRDGPPAVHAAVNIQRRLRARRWPRVGHLRIRIGLNSGTCTIHEGEVFGRPPNLASRLQSIGHGGQILVSETVAASCLGRLPPGEDLSDLGAYRIRGFDDPVLVHTVVADGLPADFPPLRTAYAGFEDLPLDDAVLFGRDETLRELEQLLMTRPLVTLWGAGGVGKTRLALRLAAQLRPYRDGVRFVDLAAASEGSATAEVVAAALRAQPLSGERPIETVSRVMRGTDVLLILDNCEHLLDSVRDLTSAVLRRCRRPHILVTSREPLSVRGEHAVEIEPLAVPENGQMSMRALEACASVRLFVDRAQESAPSFALTDDNAVTVAAVCRSLDGVPLALELAASCVGVEGLEGAAGSPAALYARLDAATGGQGRTRNLDTSVNWSYSRLSPGEAELFIRLSAFSGPFSRELAIGLATDARRAERDFERLVRTALVQRVDPSGRSFRLLATSREFARTRLDASSSQRLSHAHAELMLARARQWGPELRTQDERAAAEALSREFPEHRTAMTYLLEQGALGEAVELLVALFQFCVFQPRPEAYDWAATIAGRLDHGDPRAADVFGAAALGAWFSGDTDRATTLGLRAVEAGERIGHAARWARTALTDAYGYAGNLEAAWPHYLALVTGLRKDPEPFWQINGLGHEAIGLLMTGRTDAAMARATKALEMARHLANPDCTQWALYAMGRVLAGTDPRAACEAFERAMAASREVGSRFNVSLNLVEWVAMKRRLGDHRAAITGGLDLVDLLATSGNRSQLSQALGEVALLLAAAGRVTAAATVRLARRGLPSMPKGADLTGVDSGVDHLEELLADQWSQLAVRASAFDEFQLIELCRSELTELLQTAA